MKLIVCAHPLAGLPSPLAGEGGAERRVRGDEAETPHPSAAPTPSSARGEGKESAASTNYTFGVPLIEGDHVTDDAGTGFVHTAPGHGREDFDVWTSAATQQMLRERHIDTAIPYTVDADSFYTKDAPGFEGKRVIKENGDKGDANEAVIAALIAIGQSRCAWPPEAPVSA